MAILAEWVVVGLLYLLFAGTLDVPEAVAAALGGGVAMGFAAAVGAVAPERFAFRGVPWGRLLAGVAASLVRETVAVGAALLRAGPGATGSQPFEHGGEAPEERTRRALVELALSAAPNGVVTGENHGALAIHHLRAGSPPAADARWPL